jgi:hypothetical protein
MVHDNAGTVTVHVLPPGAALTTYDVGAGPLVGGETVIVALSSPTTTVEAPGAFGAGSAIAIFETDPGPVEPLFTTRTNVPEGLIATP